MVFGFMKVYFVIRAGEEWSWYLVKRVGSNNVTSHSLCHLLPQFVRYVGLGPKFLSRELASTFYVQISLAVALQINPVA